MDHISYLRSSIRIVSIVFSRFQVVRQGSSLGLTTPLLGLTQGMLTMLTNWIVGGLSGYSGPQCILTE